MPGATSSAGTDARLDRRTFLGALGAIATAAVIKHPVQGIRFPDAASRDRLDKIGLQLYTIRDAMQADFEGSLRKVAQIGYSQVEFAGYFGHTAKQVRAILDRYQLTAPSAHVDMTAIRGDWHQTLEDAQTIGHRYVVCAWIDAKERSADGYKRIAGEFNAAAEVAKQAGLGFAYHNHSYEFAPVDGQLPYDLILENSNPSLVKMEMDIFWITKGGKDPLAYFAKYPGRFPMIHAKDMDAAGNMADVGSGTIDFATILAHGKQAGIRYVFVEHDEPRDPFADIARSYSYLRALNFTPAP